MRSRGNANYWHKITQGFPPECLNCPTPSHCRSEPEGTAGYCRTAVEGPVARTVAFNLAMRYCHRAVRPDTPILTPPPPPPHPPPPPLPPPPPPPPPHPPPPLPPPPPPPPPPHP